MNASQHRGVNYPLRISHVLTEREVKYLSLESYDH